MQVYSMPLEDRVRYVLRCYNHTPMLVYTTRLAILAWMRAAEELAIPCWYRRVSKTKPLLQGVTLTTLKTIIPSGDMIIVVDRDSGPVKYPNYKLVTIIRPDHTNTTIYHSKITYCFSTLQARLNKTPYWNLSSLSAIRKSIAMYGESKYFRGTIGDDCLLCLVYLTEDNFHITRCCKRVLCSDCVSLMSNQCLLCGSYIIDKGRFEIFSDDLVVIYNSQAREGYLDVDSFPRPLTEKDLISNSVLLTNRLDSVMSLAYREVTKIILILDETSSMRDIFRVVNSYPYTIQAIILD